MASESVPAESYTAREHLEDARMRIDEAIALQEMAWRTSNDNEEDFGMLQNVCHVTFRLLEEAKRLLSEGAPA